MSGRNEVESEFPSATVATGSPCEKDDLLLVVATNPSALANLSEKRFRIEWREAFDRHDTTLRAASL